MFEMSWITAILQLYSQVADLFGNVIVKRIKIRLFDLLARFHYILNLPRMFANWICKSPPVSHQSCFVLTYDFAGAECRRQIADNFANVQTGPIRS